MLKIIEVAHLIEAVSQHQNYTKAYAKKKHRDIERSGAVSNRGETKSFHSIGLYKSISFLFFIHKARLLFLHKKATITFAAILHFY